MTNAYIFYIIIRKLCYCQYLDLIIIVPIIKDLKIHFYYTILSFYLAFNLSIKSNKKLLFDF